MCWFDIKLCTAGCRDACIQERDQIMFSCGSRLSLTVEESLYYTAYLLVSCPALSNIHVGLIRAHSYS